MKRSVKSILALLILALSGASALPQARPPATYVPRSFKELDDARGVTLQNNFAPLWDGTKFTPRFIGESDVTNLVSDLAAKQALNSKLTALSNLSFVTDLGHVPYFTGPDTAATFDITSFGRTILSSPTAAQLRVYAETRHNVDVPTVVDPVTGRTSVPVDPDLLIVDNENKGWLQTLEITDDEAITFSGTPSLHGYITHFQVLNSDTADHVLTIPSSYSFARNAATAPITSITIPDGATVELSWRYESETGRYYLAGDPVDAAVGGSVVTDSIWTAKGDLAVGLGSSSATRLNVGANDTIPIADSTAGTGIRWGTPASIKTALSLDNVDNTFDSIKVVFGANNLQDPYNSLYLIFGDDNSLRFNNFASVVFQNATAAAFRAGLDLEAGTDFLGYPTGTPDGTKFLRDDNSWQTVSGGAWGGITGTLADQTDLQAALDAKGTGTVTSFSAGDLSPLFTTSEATATTTPALTFALSNAAAWSIFGNGTSGSAAPAFETATGTGSPVRATSPSLAGATVTSQLLNSTAGAASGPASYHTGAIFTGGTGTTNFPHVFIQPTGTTAATTWSTAGTALGINAPTGFTGNLIDAKLTGASTSAFKVTSAGVASMAGVVFDSSTANASSLVGSSGTRVSYYAKNTNSAGNTSFYFENNRGSLASYGGLLIGGSADAAGNLFGVSRADKLFLIADGASNLGMAIGTLQAQQLILGTNNTANITIASGGAVTLSSSLTVTGASTLTGGATVPSVAYGAGWDGSTNVPTRNDVYDKIEAVAAGVVSYTVNTRAAALNTAYKPSTTRDTLVCASVNIVNAADTGDGKIELLSDAANPPTTVIGTFLVKTSSTGGITPPTVTNTGGGMLMGVVKVNHYYYLKTTNTVGTNTFAVTGNVMENVQ